MRAKMGGVDLNFVGRYSELFRGAAREHRHAPIPDFSGVWTKPYLGWEPPLSGPGPVANTARVRQIFDVDGRPLSAAKAPLVGAGGHRVGDYTNPILKPEAVEEVKKHGEIELSGVFIPDPHSQCLPEGVPHTFINFTSSSSRTRSLSFITTITKSVTCA
jgi:hypothetical protein